MESVAAYSASGRLFDGKREFSYLNNFAWLGTDGIKTEIPKLTGDEKKQDKRAIGRERVSVSHLLLKTLVPF